MNFLATNLTALKKVHPVFPIEKIIAASGAPALTTDIVSSKARSGDPTLKVNGIFLYSTFNPRRESEKLIQQNLLNEAEIVVFSGFGLGYEIESYLTANPHGAALVIEPSLHLFHIALELRDFNALITSGKVSFVLENSEEAVYSALNNYNGEKIRFFQNRPLYNTNPQLYDKIRSAVLSIQHRKTINTNTMEKFGQRWIKNLFRNFKALEAIHSLHLLRDSLPYPFLLLCAGPSLHRIFPHLKQIKKRAVVVAVDTALRHCLKENVLPDFVVSVDPQYWNFRHFDYQHTSNTVMITDSSSFPGILRLSTKATFCMESVFPLGKMVNSLIGISGRLGAGGSVATTAWDFCHYAGATSVNFAGLDLGFPALETHCKGSYFEERMHMKSYKTNSAEQMAFHYFHNGNPFTIESNDGKKVYTDQRMVLYKWWFDQQNIETKKSPTSTLSPQGTKINGVALKNIEEILDFPDKRNEIDAHLKLLLKNSANTPNQKTKEQQLKRFTESVRSELESLRAHLIPILKQLEENHPLGESQRYVPAKHFSTQLDIFEKQLRNSKFFESLSFLSPELSSNSDELDIYRTIKRSLDIHLKAIYN